MSESEVAPLLRNIPEVFQIFHNVQFNTVQHRKYVKELRKLYRKIDEDAFKESFMNALHYTFTFGDANGNVDRVLQYIANFCASLNDDEEFLRFVFEVVFKCISVSGHNVRNRSCQLLGLILTALGEDASLDDDLCEKILSTQLERLQDIKGVVRCRAVLTLQRLQNPTDEEDPVTRAYTFHMSCDPSAAVRRAVVLSLAKSSRNLLHVLERLCDVDESVRKAAFLYVSSINVTQLKVRQRVHILKVGLNERSQRVRQVVETALIPGWLGTYKGKVLDLLAAIRLDNVQGAKDSAFIAKNLLQSLFKHRSKLELLEWLPIDPTLKLIPAEDLNKESAWYWRHLVRHLHEVEDTESLEMALPELVTFTGYVKTLIESPPPSVSDQRECNKRQCILEELINIFPVYDMADEVGRIALQNLLYDSLTGHIGSLDAEVIRAIMRSVDLVVPDVNKRIDFTYGIISEIHEPEEEVVLPVNATPQESTETKMLRARLRVSLNEALEEQENAVRAQDFVLAASCKEKVDAVHKKLEELNSNIKDVNVVPNPPPEVVREKRDDPETLNKCLLILNMLLDTPQITKVTPVLKSLFQNFEVMIFQNVEIRENALKTVALYSMLDGDFAKEHKAFFFTQFMDMNNEDLISTALKCVIDIMLIHGVKTFNIDQKENDSKKEKSLNKSSKRKSNAFKNTTNKSQASNVSSKSLDSESSDDESNQSCTPTAHDTIIELFLRFINSEYVQFREIVVEGFCRLLMLGQLSSSSLVSRLLLLWFNPATEEEDALRQLLGTFFPLFATHVENAQEQLEAAFIPTLTTLANAPHSSPLAEVDFEAVIKFMIGLTLPNVSPTAHNVHSNLCVLIMNALERGSELAEAMLCRALALLTPPNTADLCRDLLHSTNRIIDSVTDKLSYRNLTKFQAILSITIDKIEQRPSINPNLETLQEVPEESIVPENTPRRAEKRKSSELTDDNKSIVDSDDVETESVSSSKSGYSQSRANSSLSPTSSPPRKLRAPSAASVAKRAIRGSAAKSRTPRNTRNTTLSTPQSTLSTRSRRKVQETPSSVHTQKSKSPPKKKTKSAKALNKQLDEAEPKNNKKNNTNQNKKANEDNNKKVSKDKKNVERESLEKHSLLENDSSSDDETILFTICHDESEAMSILKDSSDEEVGKIKNKSTRPNITIPKSDSSDDLFSSDDE